MGGADIVTLGELIGCDVAPYPNVKRWLANVKKLKSWDSVNEVWLPRGDQGAALRKDLKRDPIGLMLRSARRARLEAWAAPSFETGASRPPQSV